MQAKAGDLNKRDCAAGAQGCVKDSDGQPALDRDCIFQRVGEPLIGMHSSWPVSPSLPYDVIKSLSWSIVRKVELGLFTKRQEQFEALWQTSQCPARKSGSDSLHVKQIWGGAVVFVGFALLGIIFDIVNGHSKAQTDLSKGATKNDPAQRSVDDVHNDTLKDVMEMMLKVLPCMQCANVTFRQHYLVSTQLNGERFHLTWSVPIISWGRRA